MRRTQHSRNSGSKRRDNILFAFTIVCIVAAAAAAAAAAASPSRQPHVPRSPAPLVADPAVSSSSSSSSSSSGSSDPPTIDWASLDAATLGNLSASVFLSASAADIALIPGLACEGFQAAQILVMEGSCAGITPGCAGNITVGAVVGVQPLCANEFGESVAAAFSADQWSAMQEVVFQALTANALSGLTSEACAILTAPAIESLGTGSWPTPTLDACGGMQVSCVSASNDQAWSLLRVECASYLALDVWSSFRAEQIAAMPSAVFTTLAPLQVASLQPQGCAGITAEQLASLPDIGPLQPWVLLGHTCALLTAPCVVAMSNVTYAGFSFECLGDVNANAFPLMRSDQIAALSANATRGLSGGRIAGLGAEQCSGLRPDQVAVLGSGVPPFDGCANLGESCLAAISSPAINRLAPTCFVQIPAASFGAVTLTAIANLSIDTVQFFSPAQINAIPSESCAGFQSAQVGVLGSLSLYDACEGLSSACLSKLQSASWSSIAASCLASFTPEVSAGLSLPQVLALPASAYAALSSTALVAWVGQFGNAFVTGASAAAGESAAGADDSRASQISAQSILALKAAVAAGSIVPGFSIPSAASALALASAAMGTMDANALTALELAYCVAGCMQFLLSPSSTLEPNPPANLLLLPLRVFRGLRGDQISAMPPQLISQLGARILAQLQSDAVGALGPNQVSAILAEDFPALAIGALSVTNGAWASLSAAQIQSLSAAQVSAQLSCAQYNNFTSTQRALLPQSSAASLNQQCSGGLVPAPPCPVCPPTPCDPVGYGRTEFLGGMIGVGVGTLVLCALMYACVLRPSSGAAGTTAQKPHQAQASQRMDGSVAGAEYSSSGSSGAAHPRDRRYMAQSRSIKDMSLRAPLNPSPSRAGSVGAAGIRASSSPILKHSLRGTGEGPPPHLLAAGAAPAPNTTPPYSQAELQDHLDDEDEDIGSRF